MSSKKKHETAPAPAPTKLPIQTEPPPDPPKPADKPPEDLDELPQEPPLSPPVSPPLPHSLAFITQEIGFWGGRDAALSQLFVDWLDNGTDPRPTLRKYATKRALTLNMNVDEYLKAVEEFYDLLNR
jgi:hypothetical protein